MAAATTFIAGFAPELPDFGKSRDATTPHMRNESLSMNITFGIGQFGWIRIFWLARPKRFYLQMVPTENMWLLRLLKTRDGGVHE